MVFARKIDKGLASLVKKLDAVVAKNKEKEMAALVNFVGEDPEALQKAAAKFAEKNKITNTALAVPEDHENGPKQYGIAAKTSLAVVLYCDKKVQVLHALPEGRLDKKRIAAIVADTSRILPDEKESEKQEKPDKGEEKKEPVDQ